MSPSNRRCRIVLMGMMGSGKSTIGRLLAERTGWPYHDNDVLLQRARGETAREVLAVHGEANLRRAESAALELGLTQPEPCLVGAPAGTIVNAGIRDALAASALVVWLRATPETLAVRAAGSVHRPWLAGDALGWMRATLAERQQLYESVADHTVDTDHRSPEDVAADVLSWLGDVAPCRGWLGGDR